MIYFQILFSTIRMIQKSCWSTPEIAMESVYYQLELNEFMEVISETDVEYQLCT